MPSRALLTEAQTISAAEVTQALANQGIARVSLSAPVTRTSTATLTNTGLSALTVSLLPSSRYRLTYRLYAGGNAGYQIGFDFPSSLPQFDAIATFSDNINPVQFVMFNDWPTNYAPDGDPVVDVGATTGAIGGLEFTADIKTGSTANTYGDFAVIFAQSTSGINVTTMSQNSCVEVLKF